MSLDFEISVNDSLDANCDKAWYRRCFLRRYIASEKIAAVCPALKRCEWTQLRIDSEENDEQHAFVVREEAGGRIVRPVVQWWMANDFRDEHGGPLPDVMMKENWEY